MYDAPEPWQELWEEGAPGAACGVASATPEEGYYSLIAGNPDGGYLRGEGSIVAGGCAWVSCPGCRRCVLHNARRETVILPLTSSAQWVGNAGRRCPQKYDDVMSGGGVEEESDRWTRRGRCPSSDKFKRFDVVPMRRPSRTKGVAWEDIHT